MESKLIYRFSQNSTSLDNLLTLSDKSCIITYSTDIIGTGTAVDVVKDGEIYESYTAVLFGDVNSDGWYDGTDALIVNCIANGMLTEEDVGEAVWFASDCNHDGTIDEFDVEILNYAGLLLNEVDQTLSTNELVATSAYQEYIQLIDQSPDMEETEDPVPTEPTPEQPNQSIFIKIISFIFEIFKLIFKLFR